MNIHSQKTEKQSNQPAANNASQKANQDSTISKLVNNSPESVTQRKWQETANASTDSQKTAQLQEVAAPKENKTGLPDSLKAGIESLSGYSMDDVKVHYNSDKPAQLQAHAYAQGTDIHIASGQEKHLAHEAWHVVQQKQGRVKPTTQLNKIKINNDTRLESEADTMGNKAMQLKPINKTGGQLTTPLRGDAIQCMSNVIQLVTPLANNRLNVVGEDHPETEGRLDREKQYTAAHAGSANYWTEARFRTRAFSFWRDYLSDMRATADPFEMRFNHSQQFLAENAVIIKNEGDLGTNTLGALDNLNSQRKFIHNLWIYLSNLDAGFMEDRSDGFEVPADRRTEMLGYRQQIKNIAVTWQAARADLAAAIPTAVPPNPFGWANGGVAVTSEANERANHKKSIDDLGLLNIVAKTTAQLSQDRSAAMHAAANNRSTELGVWKVGDAHAGHMTGMNPKTYNLVRRAAFNADYNTWNP